MPKLPDLDIPTQEQYDLVVAALPGSTPEEKIESYRSLVFDTLISFVFARESAKATAAIKAKLPPLSGKNLWG